MREPYLIVLLRACMGYVVVIPALALPYALRVYYMHGVAFLAHLPFKTFGRIARYFLRALRIRVVPTPHEGSHHSVPSLEITPAARSVAILYSGGTDSTCAAAIAATQYTDVHLLTFYERATKDSPYPEENIALLKRHFPHTSFTARYLSIDALVRFFSYEQYVHTVGAHGVLAVATCGYSSLSWHVRTITYCLENDVKHVMDGLTRELMHFPGHMDEVVGMFRELYAAYGITYTNPVREWEVPPDQQLIDRVVVGHGGIGALVDGDDAAARKTTGMYLYERGIFLSPNVKGSRNDFLMQHDCYPFVLYNIVAFWLYLSFESYETFAARIARLMRDKVSVAKVTLDEHVRAGRESRLVSLV